MELLIENMDSILEYIPESSKSGKYLGVLSGVIADYNEPTRNGRLYSKKLWQNVFDDPRVKEAYETKTLFGEADHPEVRLETSLKEVAVVLNKYKFDDSSRKLLGEFHILNTPNGKILNTLAEYGCKLGVSSRGKGKILDNNIVEDSSYILAGFDIVTLPAVKSARQQYSSQLDNFKSFESSILEQINECSSIEDLSKMKSIVEKVIPQDKSKILITHIDKKLQDNVKLDYSNTITNNQLMEDLEKACNKISELESQLSKLKSNENSFNKINTIDLDDIYLELANLRSEIIEQSENKNIVDRLSEALNQKINQINLLTESNNNLLDDNKFLKEELDNLKFDLKVVSESLEEKLNIEEDFEYSNNKIRKLENENKNLSTQLIEFSKKYIDIRSMQVNIPANNIINLLPEDFDIDDIENLISQKLSEKARKSQLPINSDKTILENLNYVNESSNMELDSTRHILKSIKAKI